EMADALGLEGEQEDEGASSPGLDGDRLVGQATLQELPALFIVEQVCGFLARDGRDGELTAETTGRGPVQEVADAVAALGAFLVEPAVQVVLTELSERGSLRVDPGQKVQGDQDPATQLAACGGGVGVLARAGTGGQGWRARLACRPGGGRARQEPVRGPRAVREARPSAPSSGGDAGARRWEVARPGGRG